MEIYNKLQRLGKGTYGTVYLGEKKHNKQKIVIKEIYHDLDKKQLEAAKNEVQILKSLKNPNVIKYHDSFLKNGTFFIVMEYARHGNLFEYISTVKPKLLQKQEVLSIFTQILMGLDHIHSKKIIHRDLKCENIFLTGRNTPYVVKIGDYGISKELTANNKANTMIGTTNYIAPEICDGQAYDTKSDIWSLGCILYELCAMERLFDGSVSNVVLSIKAGKRKLINLDIYGEDIQEIINLTVQVHPQDRPSTPQLLTHYYIFPITHTLMLELGNIVD